MARICLFPSLSLLSSRARAVLVGGFALTFPALAIAGSAPLFDAGDPVLPKPGYAKTLREFKKVEVEVEGLQVEIGIIPDLYLYSLAEGLETLGKSGLTGRKLESALKKLERTAKRKRDKIALRIRLENTESDCEYFLLKKLEKHLDLSSGASVSDVEDEKPKVEYLTWTIFAGAATQKMKLFSFDRLEFTAEIRLKDMKKMFSLEFQEFLRHREPEKKSVYDRRGINKGTRQITVGHYENLVFPVVRAEFFPAKWKVPKPPADFKAYLDTLE